MKKHNTDKKSDALDVVACVGALVKSGVSNDFLVSLSKKKPENWTPKMRQVATLCVSRRFREEAEALGYYPKKMVLPKVDDAHRRLDFDSSTKEFLLSFPYNWGVLQVLGDCIERADRVFDKESKLWHIPARFSNGVSQFLAAAKEIAGYEFEVTTAANRNLRKICS